MVLLLDSGMLSELPDEPDVLSVSDDHPPDVPSISEDEPELPSVSVSDDEPDVPSSSDDEPDVSSEGLSSVSDDEPEVLMSLRRRSSSSSLSFFDLARVGSSDSIALLPEVCGSPSCRSRISIARRSTSAALSGSVLSRISVDGSCAYTAPANETADTKTANDDFFIAISMLCSERTDRCSRTKMSTCRVANLARLSCNRTRESCFGFFNIQKDGCIRTSCTPSLPAAPYGALAL